MNTLGRKTSTLISTFKILGQHKLDGFDHVDATL